MAIHLGTAVPHLTVHLTKGAGLKAHLRYLGPDGAPIDWPTMPTLYLSDMQVTATTSGNLATIIVSPTIVNSLYSQYGNAGEARLLVGETALGAGTWRVSNV